MAVDTRTIDTESPAYKWYVHHVQYFQDKDVDGLLASDYATDALLMSYDFRVQGHDQLKFAFSQYLDAVGSFTYTTQIFHATPSEILLEATLETEKAGTRRVWDVFTIENGKITRHFTGLTGEKAPGLA
jgi:hypothetical protein